MVAEPYGAIVANSDITAMKEIGDRLDGKPAQAVELGGKDGEDLSFTITFVKPGDG